VFQQTLWIGSTGEEGKEQEVATIRRDERPWLEKSPVSFSCLEMMLLAEGEMARNKLIRNQQIIGSNLTGGSNKIKHLAHSDRRPEAPSMQDVCAWADYDEGGGDDG
jgi:hypothetical protein